MIDKRKLVDSIEKYYLNGLTEAVKFNIKNNVTPVTIQKDIRAKISLKEELVAEDKDYNKLTKKDKEKMLKSIEQEMKDAAKNLNFEKAAELRDLLFELKTEG